jgi:hypothetical protein
VDSRDEPESAHDAFVLTFRLFTQDNDRISLQLSKIYARRIDISGLDHTDVLSTAPLAFRAGHDSVVSCDADADRTHNLPQIRPPILSGSPCWPGRLALSGRPTDCAASREDIAGTTIRIVAEQLSNRGSALALR